MESNDTRCAAFLENAMADIQARGIDNIIVMARWSYYLTDDDFRNGLGGVERRGPFIYTAGGVPFDASLAERKAAILQSYVESLQGLVAAGKRVVLVGPVPEPGWNVPQEMLKRRWLDREEGALPPVPLDVYRQRHRDVLEVLAPLWRNPDVAYVDPTAGLCDGGKGGCLVEIGGRPLYYDDDHLSNLGASGLVSGIMKHVK